MKTFLALTGAVIALFGIAACGGSSKSSGGGGGGAAASALNLNGPGEGKLNIVNWEGYADQSFVKGFEKQTGCQVNSVPAGTSDEMFTKFSSGGGGQYDLVSPS